MEALLLIGTVAQGIGRIKHIRVGWCMGISWLSSGSG